MPSASNGRLTRTWSWWAGLNSAPHSIGPGPRARIGRAPSPSAPSGRVGASSRPGERMPSADGAGGDGGARLMAAQAALR